MAEGMEAERMAAEGMVRGDPMTGLCASLLAEALYLA
jgi:hypothetical protein